MLRKWVYVFTTFLVVSNLGFARGRKPAPVPRFTAWMVYWDEVNSRQGFLHSLQDLNEVSVFAYDFDGAGRVVPAEDELLSFKSWIPSEKLNPGPRFLYTVVNDRVITESSCTLKDPQVVHQAIGTPEARARHIQELVAIAAPVDGIEIDYEHLDVADRQAFTDFIHALSVALHARRKWLSVVVQPRTPTTALINQSGAGVIDWVAIVPWVDEFKVMAYMFHYETSAPGSIAPLAWLGQLATYAQTIVPADKLCLILHLGGYDWPAQGPGQQLDFAQAVSLAAAHATSIDFDPESGSDHFSYSSANGSHAVWIESNKGLQQKITALAELGVRQVGFWRLGTGDPRLWEDISQMRIKKP